MLKIEVLTLLFLLMRLGIKKHTLTVLLTLEITRVLIIYKSLTLGLDMFYGLIIVCIGACEGAVGLRMIIGINRLKILNL